MRIGCKQLAKYDCLSYLTSVKTIVYIPKKYKGYIKSKKFEELPNGKYVPKWSFNWRWET